MSVSPTIDEGKGYTHMLLFSVVDKSTRDRRAYGGQLVEKVDKLGLIFDVDLYDLP